MEIIKTSQQNFTDINKANQLFEVIGKIKSVFINGLWTYKEEIYEQSNIKVYPDDTWEFPKQKYIKK